MTWRLPSVITSMVALSPVSKTTSTAVRVISFVCSSTQTPTSPLLRSGSDGPTRAPGCFLPDQLAEVLAYAFCASVPALLSMAAVNPRSANRETSCVRPSGNVNITPSPASCAPTGRTVADAGGAETRLGDADGWPVDAPAGWVDGAADAGA